MTDTALSLPEKKSISIRDLSVVGGIAFAVRFIFFTLVQHDWLTGNEYTYWSYAHRAIRGNFSHSGILPGWPMVLEFFVYFGNSLTAAKFFVVLLGSLNCVFLFYLGAKLFNRKTALLAGLLLAIYPEQTMMSSCLYVETFVESLVLIMAILVFCRPTFRDENRFLAGVGFLFGLTMIVKHFMILPFAGVWASLFFYFRLSWRKMSLYFLSFLVPVFIFGLVLALHQQDPLMMLTSPLKSMQEWQVNRPITWVGYQRTLAPLNEAPQLVHQPAASLVNRWQANFFRLWGCDSSPIFRLKEQFFSNPKIPARPFILALVISHMVLMLVGGLGLISASTTPFKTYVITIFSLLTLMTLLFYMEARYRDPFMGLLILFAANFLCSSKESGGRFSDWTKTKSAVAAVMGGVLVWVLFETGKSFF